MVFIWKKMIRCTRYLRSKQTGSSLIDIYVKNLHQLRKFLGREKRNNGTLSSNRSTESNSLSSMASAYRESVVADARWSLIQPEDSNRAVVAASKAWFVVFLAMGSKRMVVLIMVVVFLLLLQGLFISRKFLEKEKEWRDSKTGMERMKSLWMKIDSEIFT